MPANRRFTDAERTGDVLVIQSDEIAQFHDLGFHRIFPGQLIQRFVDEEKFFIFDGRGNTRLIQLDSFLIAAAFELAL